MNKAKDFYSQKENFLNYDAKYLYGKPFIDNLFDESIIKLFSSEIFSNKSVLEVGSFTGRISKKLEKLNIIFDQCDVHEHPIYKISNSNKYFQIDLSAKQFSEKKIEKYDFIICIGHQVSFSNNVELAIQNLYNLLNKGGVLIFDIPQTGSINNYDEYEFQTCYRDEIIEIALKNQFEIQKVIYGQTLFYHLHPYLKGEFYPLVLNSKILTKIYFFMDKYFFSKMSLLNKKSQNIYFKLQKI